MALIFISFEPKLVCWHQFRSKDFDEPNMVKIFIFDRLMFGPCSLHADESGCFCDSMSMLLWVCIVCIDTFSNLFALRNEKIIRLTTTVATITADKHMVNVSISCGLPSIETLGTRKKRKKWKKCIIMFCNTEMIHIVSNISQLNRRKKWFIL